MSFHSSLFCFSLSFPDFFPPVLSYHTFSLFIPCFSILPLSSFLLLPVSSSLFLSFYLYTLFAPQCSQSEQWPVWSPASLHPRCAEHSFNLHRQQCLGRYAYPHTCIYTYMKATAGSQIKSCTNQFTSEQNVFPPASHSHLCPSICQPSICLFM